WFRPATPSAMAWAQRALAARPDRLAALTELHERGVAALVLRGEKDATAGTAEHQEMATAPGTTVVQVDGAGHLSAAEAPQEVAQALTDLWQRATPTSA